MTQSEWDAYLDFRRRIEEDEAKWKADGILLMTRIKESGRKAIYDLHPSCPYAEGSESANNWLEGFSEAYSEKANCSIV